MLKSIGGILALAAAAAGVLFLADYLRYWQSPEYRVERGLKELERQYREDKYGGDTPEETLRLFIDALKKGDVELASRYFLIEDQRKELEYLKELKNGQQLQKLLDDATKLHLTKKDNELAFFIITNDKRIVEVEVVIGRAANGKWKIIEL